MLYKKTNEYNLNFLFLFESTILRLIIENDFTQLTASSGHTVVYTIGPIFQAHYRLLKLNH